MGNPERSKQARVRRKKPARPPAPKASPEKAHKSAAWHRLRPGRGAIFLVLFYVYLALEIDPRLFYHGGGLIDNFPSFDWGWDFFRGSLAFPGGIVEYLSAFAAQSFDYSWFGAAVVTGQAAAICWCTAHITKTLGASRLRGLRFLGPILLLAVYSRYGFHFVTTMGLLAALAGVCFYLSFVPNRTGRAFGFFLVLFLLLYVAAGGPSLLFVALCGLYELLWKRRFALGLVQLALGAVTPRIVGLFVYRIRAHDAYFELLPLSWKFMSRSASQIMLGAVWTLYLFLPLTMVLLGLWRLVLERRDAGTVAGARTTNLGRPASRPKAIRTRIAGIFRDESKGAFGLNLATLALIGLTVVTLLFYRDTGRRNLLRVDYFSCHGMWEEVLALGRRSPYRYFICHAVNRALYHTDRLGDEMFAFPQRPEALFLTDPKARPLWQKFDVCIDLGLVNQAENALILCSGVYGERPLLLRRLATVNMIKGNIETARVYLEALRKVPFWSSVARDALAQLDSDPDLSEDEQIQHWRSVRLKTDFVRDMDTLSVLLAENPGNRMASQYGMAALLLSRNLGGFLQMFNTYHRDLSRIPRHYEEALVLLRYVRKQPLGDAGHAIHPETERQFQEFTKVYRGGDRDTTATRAALRERFGDTYFYYYFCDG